MRSFILSLPGKFQAIFVIGIMIILAFVIAMTSSMFFDAHQLATNTDLTSAIYQVMGTIYAILLTFTLWGVWQNFSEAGLSVQKEAYALLDLVHMLETSLTWKNSKIRHAALVYAKIVVEKEWPTLKSITNAVINIQECSRSSSLQIVEAVQSITPNNERDITIFGQVLNLLNHWLDARRTRILIARGDSARALWPLLFTGAFVLFAFHGLFVAKTIGIWITLLLGTSLVIGVTFYLILSLDCPFDGGLSIDSEPFTLIINILEKPNFAVISSS